jgi:DNA-binding beta-propeller fold protein YncE
VQISLTTDGANVTDVAIARSGAYIAAVNPDLNRLFLVEFDSRNVVPTDITGCQNPRSLQFVAGDQRLAVLCVNSKTLELFSVAGTTATPYRSLPVGSDTKKPLALYYDASGLLYISLEEGGLQVVDAGSSNPEVSSVAGFDSVIAGSFFIQP